MGRNTTTKTALALLTFGCLLAEPAHALRCESRVIGRGDHASKVLRYCGEPVQVETRRMQQQAWFGDAGLAFNTGLIEEVVVEEWTYNFGPYKLMPVVVLANGVVTDVRYLGYGYNP